MGNQGWLLEKYSQELGRAGVPLPLPSQLLRSPTPALPGLPLPQTLAPPPQNWSPKFFVQLHTESCKSVPLFSVACTLPLIQFPFCLFSVQPHLA